MNGLGPRQGRALVVCHGLGHRYGRVVSAVLPRSLGWVSGDTTSVKRNDQLLILRETRPRRWTRSSSHASRRLPGLDQRHRARPLPRPSASPATRACSARCTGLPPSSACSPSPTPDTNVLARAFTQPSRGRPWPRKHGPPRGASNRATGPESAARTRTTLGTTDPTNEPASVAQRTRRRPSSIPLAVAQPRERSTTAVTPRSPPLVYGQSAGQRPRRRRHR